MRASSGPLDFRGRIVTMRAMDRPHPQLAELERQIAWFIAHPEFDRCVVAEPESASMIWFDLPLKSKRGFRSASLGRIMHVELTPDEAVREELMLKIGFEPDGRRKGNYDGLRNQIFPHYAKPAMHAKQAASDVIRVMTEVFALGEEPWLWTFNSEDADEWPNPLPKPAVWPPPDV